MADPFTVMGFGMQALGFLSAGKARKARKRANKIAMQMAAIQNVQAGRATMRQLRSQQAMALTGFSASGADISSSGFQGTKAYTETLGRQALLEQDVLAGMMNQRNKYLQKADQYSTTSQTLTGIGSMAASYGMSRE